MIEAAADFPAGGVLIAGGTGGLGSAMATAFAAGGVPVTIGYRSNEAQAAALVEELGGDARAKAMRFDLCDDEAVVRSVDAAAERWGGLHSVVYAAGPTFEPKFFSARPVAEWRDVLSQDLLAPIALFKAAIPHLRRSRGSVLAVTTYQAERLKPTGSWSSVPKAGVERLIECIAKEEGRYGVRANAIRAGFINAGLGAKRLEDPPFAAMVAKESALGRPGTANEIAAVALFLASVRASYVTGAIVPVDGGQTL